MDGGGGRGPGKQELVDRIHALLGLEPEPLGPGSKERKRTFALLAEALALPGTDDQSKPEVVRAIADDLGVPWDRDFVSTGDSITTRAISLIVDAAERRFSTSTPPTEGQGETMDSIDVDDDLDDGRADLERTIAEAVATLSSSEVPPPGQAAGAAEMSADEVDFVGIGWLVAVAQVQGWLHLEEPLQLSDPTRAVATLCVGLGLDPGQAVEPGTAGSRLTLAGLERLRDRCDRATAHQQSFLEDLDDDDVTRTAATNRWEEAWEEEEVLVEEASAEPVSAKAMTLPIVQFSDMAEERKLNLSPSYQRGDVWPTSDAQLLMESILRGIPLPSVIILKPEDQFASMFEVVDGKQRLTSILRFIGRHPQALERVERADAEYPGARLLELFRTDYRTFRRAWKNATGEALGSVKETQYYFPFKLRTGSRALSGDLSGLQGRYYTEIRAMRISIADEAVEVRQVFERNGVYNIPVIEYSRATRRQIHEVFNLYNKQGKHLNAEEIRNALFHQLDMMRALIVASGDNASMEEVAGFLEPVWRDVGRISTLLDDYGFGEKRYRRTKVLSWLASITFQDSMERGAPALQSTARHIDTLLTRIESDPRDPLMSKATIREGFALMSQGIWAHSSVPEAWAPGFRHNKGLDRWQELQLVASLLGVTLAASVLGAETADRLAQRADEVEAASATRLWARPSKTQTKTQWEYIGRVGLAIVELLGVDLADVEHTMTKRFTFSPVATLRAARDLGTHGG